MKNNIYLGSYFVSNRFKTSSPTYKNIVDAENFGDAFKDMLAPGINILIRAVSIIAMFVMILVI